MDKWDRDLTEDELFTEHEYLIRYAIGEISNPSKPEYEDLYQEGSIALLSVIRKIKQGLEFANSEYIVKSIRRRCMRYAQRHGTTLHVPRRAYQEEKEKLDAILLQATPVQIDEYTELCTKPVWDTEERALLPMQIQEIMLAVERLPENRKRIMRVYFECGMDVKETARIYGCSVKTVYRARAFLREKVRYLRIFDKDKDDGETRT